MEDGYSLASSRLHWGPGEDSKEGNHILTRKSSIVSNSYL